MMIESYAAISLLVIFAFVGLVKIIDEALDSWRDERDEQTYTRWLMRNNVNQIIEQMANKNDEASIEMLRVAFADSLGEYRKLS